MPRSESATRDRPGDRREHEQRTSCRVRESGSASQIAAANAGNTTTAWKATSSSGGKAGEVAGAGSVGDEDDEQSGERRSPASASTSAAEDHRPRDREAVAFRDLRASGICARGFRLAHQYGGCSAHQGPSALKAFQKAVFAGASSSASSMSGVTSAWIVGVKRWSAPTAVVSSDRRAGSRDRSGTRRCARPWRR